MATALPLLWFRKDPTDRTTFVTRDRFTLDLEHRGELFRFDCPAGFRFDLASVPRMAWSLLAPFELGQIGPLVHDWLYRQGDRTLFTRAEADRLFLELMLAEGIPPARAKIAYRAVRFGGGLAWKRFG